MSNKVTGGKKIGILMAIFILAALILFPGLKAEAAITQVQKANGKTAGASTTVSASWGSATTAGNLLVAIIGLRNSGTITPPTVSGNAWTLVVRANGTNVSNAIYYIKNASSQSGASSWTLGTSSQATLHLVEYSGADTVSPLDVFTSNTGTTSPTSSGVTSATSQANEVAVSGVNDSAGASPAGAAFTITSSGWTEEAEVGATTGALTSRTDGAFDQKILSATGTQEATNTYSHTANWAATIATFKEAGDVTAPTVTNVTSSLSNGSYTTGQLVPIQITFSESVNVVTTGGTPSLALNSAGTAAATYASGSGSATLTFNYTVAPGDTSSDLDYSSTTSLSLNGGTIKDAAGNNATLTLATPGASGSLGFNKNIIIDTTAPAAPGTPDMTAATDSGSSSTDNITNDTTPDFTISCESGATVDLRESTTTLGSGTCVASSVTITSSALSQGGHTITARQTDAAGNVSATSSGLSITIDATAPTLPSRSLSTNNTIGPAGAKVGDTVTLSFSSSETIATPTVTFKSGGVSVAGSITVSNPSGNDWTAFYVTQSGDTEGLVTFTIDFSDVAGNAGTQATTTTDSSSVQFDKTAPLISQDTPVPSPTNDNTPNYTFSTLEAGTILYGGDCSSTSTTAFGGSQTITFNALADGTHSNCTINVRDSVGNISNTLAVNTFIVDTVSPTVSNVTSSTANGSYNESDVISIQVTFSESVNVVTSGGTPRLLLETGTTDRYATYDSGSGSDTLTFLYTVQSGDTSSDLDYVATNSLELNGGTIKDAATNNATLTLATPGAAGSLGANKAIIIDTTAPTVAEVTPVPSPTSDSTPDYTFSSTEAGTITYGGDCSSATTSATSGNNTVTFNALADGAHTNCTIKVTDAAGNDSNTLAVTAFTVTTTAPSVTNVTSSTSNSSYNVPDVISIQVTFSESVNVVTSGGTPRLLLETGTTDRYATYDSGSGSDTLTFLYTVQSGDTSSDLDYVATNSLELNGGTIKDAATNNATLTLATPGAAGSLGFNKNIVIDTTSPTVAEVTPVTTPTSDSTPDYTFSSTEAGTITYGGDCSSATTSATSGNNTVTFNALADGTHSNCTIKVTDGAGNESNLLAVSSFEIQTATKYVILDPSPGTQTAGGNIDVTIQVQNASGTLVTLYQTDVTLLLTGSATGGGLINIVNGVGSATITDTVAETVTLSLSDTEGTGLDVTSTKQATWTPGALDHFNIDTVSTQTAGTAFNLVMTAKDQYNNTVTSFTGTVDLSTNAGTITPTVSGNFSSGTKTESVSVTQSGSNKTVTSTRTGGSEFGTSNSFTVDPGATSEFILNNPGNMTVSTYLGYTVSRKDVFGNNATVGNDTVYLYTNSTGSTADFYDAPAGNVISSVAINNGSSSANFWYFDEEAGTWDITASDNSTAPDGTVGIDDDIDSVTVSVTPIVATKIIIEIPGSTANVNDVITATIKAVDGSNNLDTSFNGTVTFHTTGSATGDNVVVIITSGEGSINFTDTVAETVTLSLEDTGGTGLDVTDTDLITFNPGVVDHFDIDTVSTQTAGISFNIAITAKDSFNNVATSFTGTVDLSTNAGTITPTVSGSFSAGMRTQSLSVTESGANKTISVIRTGGVENGISNTFTVNPGATAKLDVNDPGDITAGTRAGYTVTRKDDFNNLATSGSTQVFLFTTSATGKFFNQAVGGSEITSVTITAGNSQANFWYFDDTAGAYAITVSDQSPADGATGIDDDADNIIVTASPIVATKFIIEVSASSVNVGQNITVTVKATDNSNNVDTTFNDDVTLVLSGNAAFVSGGPLIGISNGVGSAVITDNTTETITLSLSDTETTGLNVTDTELVSFTAVQTAGGGAGTGGIISAPAQISAGFGIRGSTFPQTRITLFAFTGDVIPLEQSVVSSSNRFNISSGKALPGLNYYGFFATDKDGRSTAPKIFSFDRTNPQDVFIPLLSPTIGLTKNVVTRGTNLEVEGYATPGSSIHVEIDGKETTETGTADSSGLYRIFIPTAGLEAGNHSIHTSQSSGNLTSEFSLSKSFRITDVKTTEADLNSDGTVDARDIGLFVSRWFSQSESVKSQLDFNKDGKVDAIDFSLFINNLRR